MGALEGKVAVITGAGRGIGREEALFLAGEGASVVINDMGGSWDGAGTADSRPASELAAEINAAGGKAAANFADVSKDEGAKELIDQAIDTFGDLDILVNNAGILRDGMIFSMEPDVWRSVIEVHIFGHFLPTRHAGKYWRAKSKELTGDLPSRTLVNTSSESGLFGTAGQSNYDIAKMGLTAFTIAASQELKKYNVNVNAIAPRARTRLTTSTFEGSDREAEFAERAAAAFDPMEPENIAPFVGFLATPAAHHITGQTFIVYGGSVGRVRLPHVESIIANDGKWTLDALNGRIDELFKNIPADHLEGPLGYASEIPM